MLLSRRLHLYLRDFHLVTQFPTSDQQAGLLRIMGQYALQRRDIDVEIATFNGLRFASVPIPSLPHPDVSC